MPELKNYLSLSRCQYPVFLNDTEIVYVCVDTTGKSIVKKNIKTWEETVLYNTTEIIWHLSAKGGKMFFTADTGGDENEQLYVIDENGVKNITNSPKTRHYPGGLLNDGDTFVLASNERAKQTFDIVGVNIKTGEKTMLLENNDNYNMPSGISPDGKYLLYNKLLGSSNNALWMLDIKSGEAMKAPDNGVVAAYRSPLWKNDSTGFFLISDENADFNYIAYYDVENKTFEKAFEYDWDVSNIALSSDNRYLAIITNESGYSALKIYDLINKSYVNIPQPPKGVMDFPAFSPDGKKIVFSLSSGKRPSDIWIIDIEDDHLNKYSNSLAELLTPDDLIEPELHDFTSFDGLKVPYLLYIPKGKKAENLPVMISIHGGPEGQSRPGLSGNEFLQFMVSQGIAVIQPNVRGSIGYGKHYSHLDDVEKRLDSVKDIEALVNHLVEENIAHKEKIAVMGGSYGGFMTLSCVARYPDLFCCAVDTVGMFNLVTFLENTSAYRRPHRESEYGSLENHRDILYNVSPVAMVDNIKGPLMIIHGKNDPRVPVSEAYQAAEYLEKRGVTVPLHVYDDEGHGLQKLKNRLDCYPKVIDFVKKYMNI